MPVQPIQQLEELRQFVSTTEGKREIFSFISALRAECESEGNYYAMCLRADQERPLSAEEIVGIFMRLRPFLVASRPGHDLGHFYRDFLSGLAIVSNDPYVKTAASQADVQAGLLTAGFHDVAVAVVPRYQDGRWECGHAEVGAWLFDQLTADLLPEASRQLVCYAIAAHRHFLKPEEVREPISGHSFRRMPYADEIFEVVRHGPCRLAVTIARAADRLDTNGASHWARHVAAMADASELEGAQDFSGDSFFSINEVTFERLLLPEVLGDNSDGGPTTLKHMQGFANSNYNMELPFARYDDRFPILRAMIDGKVAETRHMIQLAGIPLDFAITKLDIVWDYIRHVSAVESVQDIYPIIEESWNRMSHDQRQRLCHMVIFAGSAYEQWLHILEEYLINNDQVAPPLRSLAGRLTNELRRA